MAHNLSFDDVTVALGYIPAKGSEVSTIKGTADGLSEAIHNMVNTVTSTATGVVSIANNITTLTTNLTDNSSKLFATGTALGELLSNTTTNSNSISTLQQQITSLNSNLVNATTHITIATNDITTTMTSSISDINGQITSANSNITTLTNRLNDSTTGLSATATAISGINTSIGTINGELTSLSGTVNSLVSGTGVNDSVYYQSSTPTTNLVPNDLWINPSVNNSISIWNGTSWVTANNTSFASIAALNSEMSTRSTNDTTNSNAITSLYNQVNAATTGLPAIASLTNSNTTNISTINNTLTSQASSITSLSSSITGISNTINTARPNLCPDVNQWTLYNGIIISNDSWGNHAFYSGTIPNNYSFLLGSSPHLPCYENTTYVISGDVVLFATSGNIYFDLMFYDSSNTLLLDGGQNSLHANVNFSITNTNRNAIAVQSTAPTGSVYMIARCVAENVIGGTSYGFRQVKVEMGTLPPTQYSSEAQINVNTANITNEISTRTSADTAQANAILGISTTLNGSTTAISQALTSIDGIKGKYTLSIDSNHNVTGFELIGTGAGLGTFTLLNANLKMSGAGAILGGKSSYIDTTAGYFLGYSSGYKFNIGDNTSSLNWDGSNLIITGNIVGGVVRGTKTSYTDTSAGYFMGNSSGIYKLNVGNSTNSLNWDGSNLTVTGTVNATSGNISGNLIVGGSITGSKISTSSGIDTANIVNNAISNNSYYSYADVTIQNPNGYQWGDWVIIVNQSITSVGGGFLAVFNGVIDGLSSPNATVRFWIRLGSNTSGGNQQIFGFQLTGSGVDMYLKMPISLSISGSGNDIVQVYAQAGSDLSMTGGVNSWGYTLTDYIRNCTLTVINLKK